MSILLKPFYILIVFHKKYNKRNLAMSLREKKMFYFSVNAKKTTLCCSALSFIAMSVAFKKTQVAHEAKIKMKLYIPYEIN